MRDAFISYSSTDSTEANFVRSYLQRNGCTCWMAPDDIPAGSDYAEAIPKAIADCRTFVLILSPDAQNSNWVRKELGKAIDKGTTVIPFMIRNFKLNDAFDFLLENAQWCHAYMNRDDALKKLLSAVKAQQTTYRYKPQSSAAPTQKTASTPQKTASAPQKTVTPPKQVTSSPKTTAAQTKFRSTGTRSSSSRAFSVLLYILVIWGMFWSLTLILAGVCMFLAEHTAMGTSAFFILAIGMVGIFVLLGVLHKKDLIYDGLLDIKRHRFIRKLLLWLILTAGIFFTLVLIGGMTYLQIVGQESFTMDQVYLLAAISGVISLVMLARWCKLK